jgi:hypothetical protein
MPLPDLALVDIGGWIAVVGLVVVSLVRGWLVPGRQVDNLLAIKDQLIADKAAQVTDWREAYRAESKRGDVLAEGQRTVIEMLHAMRGGR